MQDMTFHLEKFDGPLDLLLHLLSKNKIDIVDIPIAEISEQYLEYLQKMRELDIEVTGEFIAMASHLVYIKSKMLLPVYEESDEPDPRAALIETLLDYQRVKEAGGLLQGRYEIGKELFVRPREVLGTDPDRLYQNTLEQLEKAVASIIERAGRKLPPPVESFSGIVRHRGVSVETKITYLLERFRIQDKLDFTEMVLSSHSRSEVVALFLAVLELSKTKKLLILEENEGYSLMLSGETDGEEGTGARA